MPVADESNIKPKPRLHALIRINAPAFHAVSFICYQQWVQDMVGVMLSAEEIKAAPPAVQRWIEQRASSAMNKAPSVRPAIPPKHEKMKVASAMASNRSDADRRAAIQKLIAERAYELWENHGRPHGHDLIHWRQAEQEIMECLKESSPSDHDGGSQ